MELTREQKLLQQIIAEAWDNPAFKEKLIEFPVEAIKNLTGEIINIPAGVQRVEVVDRTDPTCLHIIIPRRPNLEDVELTDDQLEVIAGGTGEETGNIDPTILNVDLDPGFTL